MAAELPGRADVVIIGAGPAGLSAAVELRRGGVGSVLVLDRESRAGGVPRHCGHSPYGMREFGRVMRGPAYAARLWQKAEEAGARVLTDVTVTALRPGPSVAVTSDAGPSTIDAGQVLLATGAREASRAQRPIGGTKPGGVLSTGALQGLVYLEGLRPFRRPVVLGSELVAFSALLTCRHAGIRPAAMIEPGPRVVARWPSAVLPRVLGVPLLTETEVIAVEGRERVEAVVLRRADREWRIEADGLLVTGGFRPEAALLAGSHLAVDPGTGGPEVDEFGRCTDLSFFAAGNLLRTVETAGWCWAEGRAVARAMLRARSGGLPMDRGRRLGIAGEALAWVLPQRIAGNGADAAFSHVQLRVNRAARGRLGLRSAGREVAGRDLSLRPERRILLPLPSGADPVAISFEEDPS